MKKTSIESLLFSFVLIVSLSAMAQTPKGRSSRPAPRKESGRTTKPATSVDTPVSDSTAQPSAPVDAKTELETIVALPPAERIEKLKAFIQSNPGSPLVARAAELTVSARAALGDEKLAAGDIAGGLDQFRAAVTESPSDMSDKLYYEVVSQIPLNLYLRGQRDASIEIARMIEALVRENPKRTLTLASYFLRIEEPTEAQRLIEYTLKLSPDSAAAHQLLGTAHHMSFRFDDAIAEYSKAIELDPTLTAARSSLADLKRATGKADEALEIYKVQVQENPQNKSARAGLVLSLLAMGKQSDAEREMDAALAEDASNLPLLAGLAYWYAAHGEGAKAVDFAQKTIAVQPRFTWAYIALGRGLVLDKKPFNADGAPRYARQFGNFPTLDYEIASALVVSGLYEEAANVLLRSFKLNGDEIDTSLANRVPARAQNFRELLAPERRASLFQYAAADTEENGSQLKALLSLMSALEPPAGGSIDERAAASAAQAFASGNDEMKAYRQIFAAERLVRHHVGLSAALKLMEDATGTVEAALDVPTATTATMADEIRELRVRAEKSGGTAALNDLPRNVRASILRGRIEDISGLALSAQGDTAQALIRFRRAVNVLPEGTLWRRTAFWHLGDAVLASGNESEALTNYIKAYDREQPDMVKRAVISSLYQKINGNLNGLDDTLGPAISSGDAAPVPAAIPVGESTNTVSPAVGGVSDKGVLPATVERPVSETANDEPAKDDKTAAPSEVAPSLTDSVRKATSTVTDQPSNAVTETAPPLKDSTSDQPVEPPKPEVVQPQQEPEPAKGLKAEDVPKTDETQKAEAPKTEEAPKIEEVPKPDETPKVNEAPPLVEATRARRTTGRKKPGVKARSEDQPSTESPQRTDQPEQNPGANAVEQPKDNAVEQPKDEETPASDPSTLTRQRRVTKKKKS